MRWSFLMAYFKSDGQFIYADTQCVEFYIPKFYFEKSSNFAEDCGSIIKALGVFDIPRPVHRSTWCLGSKSKLCFSPI